MKETKVLDNKDIFCHELQLKMNQLAPVCAKMEPYEFRYSLNNITPEEGSWASVLLETPETIEGWISSAEFFESIQIKPRVEGAIVLDATITRLTQMLFVGLVTGDYATDWVTQNFKNRP